MLLNQYAKLYFRIVLLCLFISSAILYYITSCKKTVPIIIKHQQNVSFNLNRVSNENVSKKMQVKSHELAKVSHEKKLQLNGSIYRYGDCDEEIKLAVVLCGNRFNQTLVTLKSAVVFSEAPLLFIIIADDENKDKLSQKILEWPSIVLKRLSFEIHSINFPNGTEGDEWKKLFKLCACQRLFLPSLLHHINALLYVDTDVLFLHPVEKLWNHFYKMNSSHMAALCPEHEDFSTGWYNRFARHPYYEPLGVNSGVMLMNLTRMRQFEWESYLPSIMKKYKLHIVWGDQDVINIIFHFHPDKLYIIPCEWNYRPDHCMYASVCKTAEVNGIAVIHGNRGVFHNKKQSAFKAIYKAMNEYQFEDNLKSSFVDSVLQYLREAKGTNCGKYLLSIISRMATSSTFTS